MARILVLDEQIVPYDPDGGDLPGYMAYYEQQLHDRGHEVVGISDVGEGIAKVDSEQFDLAIVDVMMPSKSAFDLDETNFGLRTGVVVARRIHALRPNLPIVILSNVNLNGPNTGDIRDLLSEGWIERYCFKPDTTPLGLANIVATVMEQ